MNCWCFSAAAVVTLTLTFAASAQPAPITETARSSKLTGTSFGAAPERNLRAQARATAADYLAQLGKRVDADSKVSDVEVVFWRSAVQPKAVEAYQKLVTDNLAQGGYTYKMTGSQTAAGVTTTVFTADSNQQGRIIGFWQVTPQGLYLNWGHLSGAAAAAAAPMPAPAAQAPAQPAAPAVTPDEKDAEIGRLKRRVAELEAASANTPVPAATPAGTPKVTPDPAATAAPGPAAAQAADNVPFHPLDESELVRKDAAGLPVVADKEGKGIDGIKLSQHDREIVSPAIAVGPDGTIHVAFVEGHRTTFARAVYYRSSADGGKTWTEAKNLSEGMPNINVGRCQVLADARNRVYVIWRAGLAENWIVSGNPSGDTRTNLWFRELEGGKWTKIKPIGETVTPETQFNSVFSYFSALDAAGRVQVLWNVNPDKWHTELRNGTRHFNGIQAGLIFQSTLDGASAGTPREVFLADIIPAPKDQEYVGPSCDNLDAMNGYADAAGEAHFVATYTTKESAVAHLHFELIENARTAYKTDFPEFSFHGSKDIPTLLIDAKGKRHVIGLYLAGEHPHIRDYLLGSDDEPTVIRAAVGLDGKIDGFQAYQGPGGRMVAIMQMFDTADAFSGDNFVSISRGDGKWSVPVNLTNNAGRKSFVLKETSEQSQLSRQTSCLPGPGAAAFDRDGHLLLLLIKQEYVMIHSTAFGVNIAGGDVKTPTLRFLKF